MCLLAHKYGCELTWRLDVFIINFINIIIQISKQFILLHIFFIIYIKIMCIYGICIAGSSVKNLIFCVSVSVQDKVFLC
jgi:hypothetical protein